MTHPPRKSDLCVSTASAGYVVCGFYTPDYERWVKPLREALDFWSQPHDFAPVEKATGGWEANTRMKAGQVLAAMNRHPGKVVIFIDVDCDVRGDLCDLVRVTRGDIGIYFAIKRRTKGARLRIRSGTLVIRPTEAARRFIEAWVATSAVGRVGDHDQTTFVAAMHVTAGTVTFQPLHRRWCVAPGDDPPEASTEGAVIVHDSASLGVRRMSRLAQMLRRALASVSRRRP